MNKISTFVVVFACLAVRYGIAGADYYLIPETTDKSYCYQKIWRCSAEATTGEAPTAGNSYWINGTVGLADSGDFPGDRLAFGTPVEQADSPVPVGGCKIRLRSSGPWNFADLALYQGECYSVNNFTGVLCGDATVYTRELMSFRVYQNGSTNKGVTRSLDLAFTLHGASSTALILNAGDYPANPTFLHLSGDFSDYHGTWKAAGRRLFFNTTSVMGCEADGPSNGVFNFAGSTQLAIANDKAAGMSRTRGVTLNSGITLALCTTNEPYACDDYVVVFPIARGGTSSRVEKQGTGRVTLDNHCSIVSFSVTDGVLALGTNYVWSSKLPEFTVEEGASLEILPGVHAVAASVTYRGEALARGFYSGDETRTDCLRSAAITGSGELFVFGSDPSEITDATWNQANAGGTLQTDANWQGGTAPNLADGSARLTFAAAGSEATVSERALVSGLTLNAPGDFTVKGDKSLTVLEGGISATSDAARGHTYTFEAPLSVLSSQPWSLGELGSTYTNRLVFRDSLCGDDRNAVITKTGADELVLEGTNSYRGALVVEGSRLTLKGTLGTDPATDGSLTGDGDKGSRFTFANAVLNKNFHVGHCKEDRVYYFPAGTTNIFRGKFTHQESATLQMEDGAAVIFEGGYEDGGKLWQRGSANCHLYVRKTPITIGSIPGNYLSPFNGRMYWQVADNTVNYVGFNYARLYWRTDVDYALGGRRGVLRVYNNSSYSGVSTIDLTTTRQCIQTFAPTSGVIQVTGEVGSCLELAPPEDGVVDLRWACLTNSVALQKHGSAQLVLSNGVVQTSGELSVTNGVLAIDASACCPYTTLFTAKGTGVLRFASRTQIDRQRAELHLAENGRLEIPEGVTVAFASGELDGVPIPMGEYRAGNTGLSAHLVGRGSLQIGSLGFMLIVR